MQDMRGRHRPAPLGQHQLQHTAVPIAYLYPMANTPLYVSCEGHSNSAIM